MNSPYEDYWKAVKQALDPNSDTFKEDESTLDDLRQFVDTDDDAKLLFHRDPTDVARDLSSGGYRNLELPRLDSDQLSELSRYLESKYP